MTNFITDDVLQSWLDRLLKDPGGQAFFVKHGSNLNKSTKVEDIAPLLWAIIKSHMHQGGPVLTQSLGHPVGIDVKYKVWYMSREEGDLFAILKEVKDWRIPGRKLIILGCFMDRNNMKAYSGSLAQQFSNLFNCIEVWNKQNFLVARSPRVFISYQIGMMELYGYQNERIETMSQVQS